MEGTFGMTTSTVSVAVSRRMNRTAWALVSAVGAGLGLAASALALPPVLERVPDDAAVAIAIPSPQTLEKNLGAFNKAIESGEPLPEFKDLLSMTGMSKGIDLTKSLAFIIYAPKPDAHAKKADAHKDDAKKDDAKKDEKKSDDPMGGKKVEDADMDGDEGEDGPPPQFVVLVPVTNYGEFLDNFGVKPAGEGKIDLGTGPDGSDLFMKDIGGGYAVVGEAKETIEKFDGKANAAGAKSRLGKAGEALADASDLVTIVNMDAVRPMALEGLKKMEEQAKERMGALGEAQQANFAFGMNINKMIIRDTKTIVGGLKVGEKGLGLDMVTGFIEGSALAKAFAGEANATPLLKYLPGGPYLAAGALDLKSPALKQFVRDLFAQAPKNEMPEATKAGIDTLLDADGQAVVVGFPMGGALSGLLTNTVSFTATSDPAKAKKNIRDAVTLTDGKTAQGMTYKSTYQEGAAKAGDVALDAWDMKLAAQGDAGAGAAQALGIVFGPQGGPAGYVAQNGAGVYRSYAKNSDLMSKALAASSAPDNVGADALIGEAQGHLPKNRFAELHIGTKSVMDLALPFAAIAGVQVPMDKIPQKLEPVSLAISSEGGAGRFTIFVPTSLVKTGVVLGQTFMEAQQGGGAGQGPNGGKQNRDSGAGQPKF